MPVGKIAFIALAIQKALGVEFLKLKLYYV
jgi:hypothetical protein